MSSNQGAGANFPHDEVNPLSANTNIDDQNDQTMGFENLHVDLANANTSQGHIRASEQGENPPDQVDEAGLQEDRNADLLVRTPDALRREARMLMMLFDVHSAKPPPVNARLIAIETRLSQLISGENEDIQLMTLTELQTEGVRLWMIIDLGDNGQALSDEDVTAITRRSDAVNSRLVELRLATIRDEQLQESRPDIQSMSPDELDDELDRLVAEFRTKSKQNPVKFRKDLDEIRKRSEEAFKRQAELTHFPADNSEDTLEEDQIQKRLLSKTNLPRFLFRGSNARSGGNGYDSDLSSSDDGDFEEDEVESRHTVRMINEAGRVVPHAHFADPTMLNHPRRQTFQSLLHAASNHTSARQFNTPFTSWSCDFETALYFAIGHYPSLDELHYLEAAGEQTDWIFHEADVPADVTVIDTWTIPDRHLRVFHQPDLLLNPNADPIPSEFLIYGALDRADGVDLRGVSIQELSISLRCPTWPLCDSRVKFPHQPTLQDVSEAWTIASAFFMQDWNLNEGGEVANADGDDVGLAVLAGELARQQWDGSPPRPNAHEYEAQVQLQWPETWLRRIRGLLARVSPGELLVSGTSLANDGAPAEGFPQVQLMQQLLLSWDESDDDDDEDDDDDGHDIEDTEVAIALLRHDCANPTLRGTFSELERTTFWSQMVQRDRDGNVPASFTSGTASSRNNSLLSTNDKPNIDDPNGGVATGDEVTEDEPALEDQVKQKTNNNAGVDNSPVEDVPAQQSATEKMPTEADNLKNEPTGLERHSTGRQHPEASARESFPEGPKISGQNPRYEPQEHISLRGDDHEHWEVEVVPFTPFRLLIFFVMCLLTALYLALVMAVY